MIKQMLARVRLQKKRHGNARRSAMRFCVDGTGGEIIRRAELGTGRSILRRGNAYVYVVGNGGIGNSDMQAMEAAKAAVIDRLAAEENEISAGMMPDARDIARAELLRTCDPEKADFLAYLVAHDTVGSGPFSMLMEDSSEIEEIEVNSARAPLTVYTSGFGRCQTNLRFVDEDAFRSCINKFIMDSEKELGEDSPVVDAQVGDARVHAQMRPYVLSGAAASIRIGKGKAMGLYSLLKSRTLDARAAAYLWIAADAGMNMVVTGAPASGKTTLLGALTCVVPRISKTVTIEEEINELKIDRQLVNVVALYGSRTGAADAKAQALNALRMRPDRLIIGEIRGEEARELFAGASLGVPFMTTMHSGDEELAVVKRLLIRPMRVEPRSLSMLDVSIHMMQEGIRARRISRIHEYRWLSRAETESGVEIGDGDSVEVVTVAKDGAAEEEAIFASKALRRYAERKGMGDKDVRREFRKRVRFLTDALGSCSSDEGMGDAISEYKNGGEACISE